MAHRIENEPSELDKETAPPRAERKRTNQEYSDLEKETLAVYEGHDADIPSNEGYILDERGELKRRQSIASHRRKSFDQTLKAKVPEHMARTQKTHLHPLDCDRNPPATGPTVEISINAVFIGEMGNPY